jgi:hypothetical protein
MAWTSAAKKTSAADDAEVQPADADSPTYLLTYILAHLLTYDYSPSHLLTYSPTYLLTRLLAHWRTCPLGHCLVHVLTSYSRSIPPTRRWPMGLARCPSHRRRPSATPSSRTPRRIPRRRAARPPYPWSCTCCRAMVGTVPVSAMHCSLAVPISLITRYRV